MNKIKAVLIDLDNTLYAYDKCNETGINAVVDKMSQIFNKPKDDIRKAFLISRDKVKKRIDGTGSAHSRLLYLQNTVEALKGKTDPKLTHDLHDVFWNAYMNEMRLFDGVSDFLNYAKEQEIKVAIVSDLTTDIQLKKIAKLGIDKHIELLVTSEEAGRDKPHPSIFSLALEKLELPKENVAMIGDDIKDMQGAKEFGISDYLHVKDGDFRKAFQSFKALTS